MHDPHLPSNRSYDFESLEDRDLEGARLERRAELRLDRFADVLRRHGFPNEGRVIEVGCGQGLRTRLMAELSPRAEVIGIDCSKELLESARSKLNTAPGLRNLSYREGNLYQLSFSGQSADFIYARLVF